MRLRGSCTILSLKGTIFFPSCFNKILLLDKRNKILLFLKPQQIPSSKFVAGARRMSTLQPFFKILSGFVAGRFKIYLW